MKQDSKIAVLGGNGRTGKFVVNNLISRGYSAKLLLRKSDDFETKNEPIEIINGDALNLAAIRDWMKGCSAVVSTIGQRPGEPLVATQATRNILMAMRENHIKRYILVAGINLDTHADRKGPQTKMATEWMKKTYPSIQEDRQKAFSLLAASDSDWTVARVPMIEFTVAARHLRISLEDCEGTTITAGDIASFLADQLTDTRYLQKAPFISNV